MSFWKRILNKPKMGASIGGMELQKRSYKKDFVVKKNSVLGEGMNGKVRACFSVATGEKFALKIMKDTSQSRREIEVQLMCNFHLVASIHSLYANVIDGVPRLVVVMECVEGGDLFDRILRRDKQPLSEQRVAELTREILTAVSHLHELSVAHRDIKPENIMLTDDTDSAQIKLIDFGFAKVCVGSKSLETPCYTPYYAAPEIFGTSGYDKSCDAWSIGVVVYIMMCGYPPFTASKKGTRRALTRGMQTRIQAADYVFPAKHWKGISQDCIDFIRGLLTSDASTRMTVDAALQHKWLCTGASELVQGASVPVAGAADGEVEDSVSARSSSVDAASVDAVDTAAATKSIVASPAEALLVQPMSMVLSMNPMLARRKARQSSPSLTPSTSSNSSNASLIKQSSCSSQASSTPQSTTSSLSDFVILSSPRCSVSDSAVVDCPSDDRSTSADSDVSASVIWRVAPPTPTSDVGASRGVYVKSNSADTEDSGFNSPEADVYQTTMAYDSRLAFFV